MASPSLMLEKAMSTEKAILVEKSRVSSIKEAIVEYLQQYVDFSAHSESIGGVSNSARQLISLIQDSTDTEDQSVFTDNFEELVSSLTGDVNVFYNSYQCLKSSASEMFASYNCTKALLLELITSFNEYVLYLKSTNIATTAVGEAERVFIAKYLAVEQDDFVHWDVNAYM